MRLSSYLIDINLKNRPGKTLLMHGYTGAMDIIDNSLLESLKQADATGDFSGIDNSILELLVKRNYLTEKTKEEEIEYVCRVAKILAKRNKLLNPAMFTIIVTYDCNFSCPYCFERKIIKKNMPLRSWTMDQETVDKVFTAILAIAPNEKQRNKTILLFGGEPLLKNNYDIVKYIILKGREGGYGFDAITNGFDLDCYSEFLGNDIKSVQVTIDGTRDTHDIRRPFGKNGKSFDKIISNIKIGLDKGVYVSARINVDADNIEEVGKLDAFFEHEKLYEYNIFRLMLILYQVMSILAPTHIFYITKVAIQEKTFLNCLNNHPGE